MFKQTRTATFSQAINQAGLNSRVPPRAVDKKLPHKQPKVALYNCQINLLKTEEDDVPDEGSAVDYRSLTRLQDNVIPRKSITSNIAQVNVPQSFTPKASTFRSPFKIDGFAAQD